MGKLTTHVLDTANGKPGAGMRIELFKLESRGWQRLKTAKTNKDGRTEKPLLDGKDLRPGTYRLLFFVGDYFGDKFFLDEVPIRFNVADAGANYHVPLLCSPWSYTTYRGS
jgi:5-hydroxyisourate hydrolase